MSAVACGWRKEIEKISNTHRHRVWSLRGSQTYTEKYSLRIYEETATLYDDSDST